MNARITPDDQVLLAKVAGMQGVSVSTFVIQAARERAKALLRRRRLVSPVGARSEGVDRRVGFSARAECGAGTYSGVPCSSACSAASLRTAGRFTTEVTAPSERNRFITTPLASDHDRAAFSCGKASLDNYLRDRAVPHAKGLSTVTFVLVDPEDDRTIQGYYSLSSTSLEFSAVPSRVAKKLRISKHRVMSATLIGRLAVAVSVQGQRLGEALLFDALERAYLAAQQVGSALIIVRG